MPVPLHRAPATFLSHRRIPGTQSKSEAGVLRHWTLCRSFNLILEGHTFLKYWDHNFKATGTKGVRADEGRRRGRIWEGVSQGWVK